MGTSDPSGSGAGPVPGVDEEHQREQPGDLAVVGQRRVEGPGQADRLLGEIDAMQLRPGRAGVALVEDQVQDPQDGVQPATQFVGGRQGEGDAAVL